MPNDTAASDQLKMERAIQQASGYLRLALLNEAGSVNRENMRQAAIESLAIFNDDDFIDRLYDADMREIERMEHDAETGTD